VFVVVVVVGDEMGFHCSGVGTCPQLRGVSEVRGSMFDGGKVKVELVPCVACLGIDRWMGE